MARRHSQAAQLLCLKSVPLEVGINFTVSAIDQSFTSEAVLIINNSLIDISYGLDAISV